MSDTPLTDNHLNYQVKISGTYGATPEFARNLERENNRLRTALNDIACGAACLNGYGIEDAARTAREAMQSDEDAVAHRRVHPEE